MADLRAGGVPGEILVWDDPLCMGPTPDVPPAEWDAMRAAFIAGAFGADATHVRRGLEAAQDTLASAGKHEEVVLWFEHDLFDQTVLVRLLAWFDGHRPMRLSLVTASSHPEVARFIGLGNLNARQLMELFAHRAPVEHAALAHAAKVWRAWQAPDPRHVSELGGQHVPGLPYLPAAVRRHLEELPWTGDGLSRSERLILRAARSGRTGEQVFREIMEAEDAPWMGDSMCYQVIRELARLEPALVTIGDGGANALPAMRRAMIWTTRAGERVLEGEDRVALTGIDTWVGGVRLQGSVAAWRWDPRAGPVPTSRAR